jgi:hypothetical protein
MVFMRRRHPRLNQATTHTGKLNLVTVIHGLLDNQTTIDPSLVGTSEIHHRQFIA